jgi:medium-chain acyl-[acyl-carrier-protein] hydrolase
MHAIVESKCTGTRAFAIGDIEQKPPGDKVARDALLGRGGSALAKAPIQPVGIKTVAAPMRRARTSLRLLCLPYAGGDSRLFADWAKRFASSIEVRPLDVPQRPASWAALLDHLTRELGADHNEPYAFYGHSMGALIAFEWARHLRRLNGTEPVHLFVAAQHAPQLPSPYPFALSTTDLAARETLRALWGSPRLEAADDRMLDKLFKRLEGRLHLQERQYRFEEEAPLSCPVTALYGTADAVLRPCHLQAWRAHTRGPFEMINVDGGHLFVRDHAHLVASLLAERLTLRRAA